VAKPHKHIGRAIRVASALPAERLASLCKEAADQCKLQLDEATPGRLVFSIRGITARIHIMSIEVLLSGHEGAQVMTSRIRRYKTRQQKFLGLVPLEPQQLLGLKTYERFIQRFGELAGRRPQRHCGHHGIDGDRK
jgi:hypothetical protein